MKITFILPLYPWKPIGGFRVVYEYANQLVARGHEVTVVHPRRLPNWDPPAPNFYRWLRRRARYMRDLLFTPNIQWQPIDKRVRMLYVPEPTAKHVPDSDIVFATLWATAELVLDYPLSKGKKFYLIQHYEVWDGPEERINATWRAPLKKVVIAKWLYEKGLELGVPAEQMIYIPNGINHKIFRLERPIEDRPPRVSMMFAFAEWKGGWDGVQALELAKQEFPNLQAILFGQRTNRPRKLPRWIEYRGNPSLEELVRDIYNGSAIYLCPSWFEGWHLPPAEAMACGCALVSTDIGGVRDYAIHGETALLSPPRDPEALAANLVFLLKDDQARRRFAQAGYNYIQGFTWERSTDLLERVCLQSLGRSV